MLTVELHLHLDRLARGGVDQGTVAQWSVELDRDAVHAVLEAADLMHGGLHAHVGLDDRGEQVGVARGDAEGQRARSDQLGLDDGRWDGFRRRDRRGTDRVRWLRWGGGGEVLEVGHAVADLGVG